MGCGHHKVRASYIQLVKRIYEILTQVNNPHSGAVHITAIVETMTHCHNHTHTYTLQASPEQKQCVLIKKDAAGCSSYAAGALGNICLLNISGLESLSQQHLPTENLLQMPCSCRTTPMVSAQQDSNEHPLTAHLNITRSQVSCWCQADWQAFKNNMPQSAFNDWGNFAFDMLLSSADSMISG